MKTVLNERFTSAPETDMTEARQGRQQEEGKGRWRKGVEAKAVAYTQSKHK
jgi:hypothetical protein